MLTSAIYWSSIGTLLYTYAGYPGAIHLLSKLKPKAVKKEPIEPTVSVLMAVRDGQAFIEEKIHNLLEMNYPKEKLQIVVVSDGSTDETDTIIQSFEDQGIVFVRVETPSGKPTALNHGMALATGEIVVFCDARQRVDLEAVRALTACFADPEVGAVSGELFIDSKKGPGLYWKYEKLIRSAESEVNSVPGATGALYAIRRALYEELPADLLLDDVFTPMQIVLKGYRVIFESNAKVFDVEADHDSEWKRKARTLAGNYQILHYLPEILSPLKNRIFWQYSSHKLMRLVCPFAMGGVLLSNVKLVTSPSPMWFLHGVSLAAQCAGYGLALKGALQKEKSGALSRTAYTFMLLNGAALEGFRRYLAKDYGWNH